MTSKSPLAARIVINEAVRLAPGVYIVRAETATGAAQSRFVVTR